MSDAPTVLAVAPYESAQGWQSDMRASPPGRPFLIKEPVSGEVYAAVRTDYPGYSLMVFDPTQGAPPPGEAWGYAVKDYLDGWDLSMPGLQWRLMPE